MSTIKKLVGIFASLAIMFCLATRLSAITELSQQKKSQMIQNLKNQTAILSTVAIQPLFTDGSPKDVEVLKNNVSKDMQVNRSDMKKIMTLLQTISANQQEILNNM